MKTRQLKGCLCQHVSASASASASACRSKSAELPFISATLISDHILERGPCGPPSLLEDRLSVNEYTEGQRSDEPPQHAHRIHTQKLHRFGEQPFASGTESPVGAPWAPRYLLCTSSRPAGKTRCTVRVTANLWVPTVQSERKALWPALPTAAHSRSL